eukprot:Sdes_comp13541_c0_seq2m3223
MAVSVITESTTFMNPFDSFSANDQFRLGFLIGHVADSKMYLLAAAPMFEKDSGEKRASHDNSSIDVGWLQQNATQLEGMIVGGLSIVGFFVFCSKNSFENQATKLRNTLFKICPSTCLESPSERLLLHVCSSSRKLTGKVVDIRDFASGMRPAEIKSMPYLDKQAGTLHSTFPLKIHRLLSLNKADISSNIKSEVLKVLKNHVDSHNSISLYFNHSFCDPNSSAATFFPSTNCNTQLYYSSSLSDEPIAQLFQNYVTLIMEANIHCCSFVSMKGTVKDVIRSFMDDIQKSLKYRTDLLFDDVSDQLTSSKDPSIFVSQYLPIIFFPGFIPF